MTSVIGKKLSHKLINGIIAILFLNGCATFTAPGGEGTWARSTLRKLSLREKIAQIMVYSMNKRLSPSWLENTEILWSEAADTVSGVWVFPRRSSQPGFKDKDALGNCYSAMIGNVHQTGIWEWLWTTTLTYATGELHESGTCRLVNYYRLFCV